MSIYPYNPAFIYPYIPIQPYIYIHIKGTYGLSRSDLNLNDASPGERNMNDRSILEQVFNFINFSFLISGFIKATSNANSSSNVYVFVLI